MEKHLSMIINTFPGQIEKEKKNNNNDESRQRVFSSKFSIPRLITWHVAVFKIL